MAKFYGVVSCYCLPFTIKDFGIALHFFLNSIVYQWMSINCLYSLLKSLNFVSNSESWIFTFSPYCELNIRLT